MPNLAMMQKRYFTKG